MIKIKSMMYTKTSKLEKKQRELKVEMQMIKQGRKNTKYFVNLKKRHYKNSLIRQPKIDDDKFVTSDKDI